MYGGPGRLFARSSMTRAFALRRQSELSPAVPPIQLVAADLRRLHGQLESLPRGASWVRTMGLFHAYDSLLATACQQLEVGTRLLELPDGKPRILERLRLEFLLGERGLSI
jgi:hypothetical protein